MLPRDKAKMEAAVGMQPCCRDYATCIRACTPRGRVNALGEVLARFNCEGVQDCHSGVRRFRAWLEAETTAHLTSPAPVGPPPAFTLPKGFEITQKSGASLRMAADAFSSTFLGEGLSKSEHMRAYIQDVLPKVYALAATQEGRKEAGDYQRALIKAHYRWWTVSGSRRHVKLGPLALSWSALGFDICVLCRWTLHRTIEGCWQVWK